MARLEIENGMVKIYQQKITNQGLQSVSRCIFHQLQNKPMVIILGFRLYDYWTSYKINQWLC